MDLRHTPRVSTRGPVRNAGRAAAHPATPIPFAYDYAIDLGETMDWQKRLWLPVSYGELRETTLRFVRRLMTAGARIAAEDRRLAFLASLRIVAPWSAAVVEAALILDRMEGVEFSTSIPEVRYLGSTANDNPGAAGLDRLFQAASCRRPLARQIVWTAEWTPLWRLGATLASPEVLVFNRNPGLVRTARANRRRISYANVEQYYRGALASAAAPKNIVWDRQDLKALLASSLGDLAISEPLRKRVLSLLVERFYRALNAIMRQMEALRGVRALPDEVWTGTGGYWPSRIVGLEIMRRGGIVRRFDHGYNKALNRHIEQTALVEASVSTHFVFASEECAERWRNEPLAELLPPGRVPMLESLPPLSAPRRNKKPRRSDGSTRSRPRVMYTPGQSKGFWQVLPSKLPNLVYADWMLRLAGTMQKMPIDLVCRPHPGGVFAGGRHPLTTIAEVPNATFEELLEGVDVVVTDSPFSRVLCEALSSTKPIVYLDPGHDYFCDEVLPLISERCSILKLSYDDRGLPQIDAQALEDAIFQRRRPDTDLVQRFEHLLASE